jgi:hypothetical protein
MLSDFEATWRLVRGRFDDAVKGLSTDQLNWRMQDEVLTLGEMAAHVAGVEVSFIYQLTEEPLDEFGQTVARCATDGVLNDKTFPFEQVTPETAQKALLLAREKVEEVIFDNGKIISGKQIKSAIGPMIDAQGAFARLAYHPGYHQGQAHIVKTAPGFPLP